MNFPIRYSHSVMHHIYTTCRDSIGLYNWMEDEWGDSEGAVGLGVVFFFGLGR
jgi:hypothetical protein